MEAQNFQIKEGRKMKKVVVNIPDTYIEKFKYEAIEQQKSVAEILKERIMYKPFSAAVEEAYSKWLEKRGIKIL